MNTKRPSGKVMNEVMTTPTGLIFSEITGKRFQGSIYRDNLLEAAQDDRVIAILTDDKYLMSQYRMANKKHSLNLKLLYAVKGATTYIKPVRVEGEIKRLILLLREPRSFNDLRNRALQLPLEATLNDLQSKGHARLHMDKWALTVDGLKLAQ